MTLQERRDKYVVQLAQAEKQAEQAADNVQQLIGAIRMVDILIDEERQAAQSEPAPPKATAPKAEKQRGSE